MGCTHSWARNIKNVAPQKQNAICKTRAQYTKRNCAFELFKVRCAATTNAKIASFHKKI
jgi:1,2-phenylacetyl-CoA epoxidase PaaB subunit